MHKKTPRKWSFFMQRINQGKNGYIFNYGRNSEKPCAAWISAC